MIGVEIIMRMFHQSCQNGRVIHCITTETLCQPNQLCHSNKYMACLINLRNDPVHECCQLILLLLRIPPFAAAAAADSLCHCKQLTSAMSHSLLLHHFISFNFYLSLPLPAPPPRPSWWLNIATIKMKTIYNLI